MADYEFVASSLLTFALQEEYGIADLGIHRLIIDVEPELPKGESKYHGIDDGIISFRVGSQNIENTQDPIDFALDVALVGLCSFAKYLKIDDEVFKHAVAHLKSNKQANYIRMKSLEKSSAKYQVEAYLTCKPSLYGVITPLYVKLTDSKTKQTGTLLLLENFHSDLCSKVLIKGSEVQFTSELKYFRQLFIDCGYKFPIKFPISDFFKFGTELPYRAPDRLPPVPTIKPEELEIEISPEDTFPDIRTAHKNAVEKLDKYFWNAGLSASPFSGDDGYDTYSAYESWFEKNGNSSPLYFLDALFDSWGLRKGVVNEVEITDIEDSDLNLDMRDNAVITTAFGQFVKAGEIDQDLKKLALKAIKRQLRPEYLNRHMNKHTRKAVLKSYSNLLNSI